MASDDKRRRMRIQSGINPGRQRTKQTTDRQSLDSQMQALKLGEKRNNPQFSRQSFNYTETNQVIREKPKDIDITSEGRYVLSTEPSGESSIHFYPNFLDAELDKLSFKTLREEIPWQESHIFFQQNLVKIPRLVKWFGPLPYEYSKSVLLPDDKWHPTVERIREAVTQKCKMEFNSVLLNLYRNEHDGVSWHSDDEMSMGVHPTIASVSLGETRIFRLRKKPPPQEHNNFEYAQHYNVPLTSGSLLIMDGCTQKDWQHCIQKEYHTRKARINLTFRTIYKT